jgi:GLPGLI family protein
MFMKKILIALCCLPYLLLAQAPLTEGTVRYLVTNNWVKKMNTLTYLSPQRKEKIAYTSGNNEWKYYKVLHFNALQSKYEISEERAERDDENTYAWRKSTYFLTTNLKENKIMNVYEMLGKNYIVEDTIQAIKWKILNDIKEVAGHICMKATMTEPIRGHHIVAWFAMDIPLSYGPEGYQGLPGLILELDYNDGAQLVSADKMDVKKLTIELQIPTKIKGKRVNQAFINTAATKHIKTKTAAEEPWFWGLEY